VEETYRYYHQYLDTLDKWQSLYPNVTSQSICLFLAIIVQMGHNHKDMVKVYWLTPEQYFVAFYRNIMKWDWFYHILRYLHFSDHKNKPDITDKNYIRLGKIKAISDKLSDLYAKYYSLTKNEQLMKSLCSSRVQPGSNNI
jgi:hypothetical protein